MAKRVRRVLAAALAAAALATSSGCTVRAQTAYSIDGVVTPIEQVVAVSDSCATAWQGTGYSTGTQTIISAMIRAELARQIAAQQHVNYTDDALRQTLSSGGLGAQLQTMLNDAKCGDLAVGLALDALLLYQDGSGYQGAVAERAIVVNPRFGTWDDTTGSVAGTGSLSKPDAAGG